MATRVSEWRLATIDAGGECLTTVSRWWWLDRCCGMSFRTTGCHRHPSPPPNSGSATSCFIQQHQSTSLHLLLHLFSIFFSAQWHEIVPDYQGEKKERWNGEQWENDGWRDVVGGYSIERWKGEVCEDWKEREMRDTEKNGKEREKRDSERNGGYLF